MRCTLHRDSPAAPVAGVVVYRGASSARPELAMVTVVEAPISMDTGEVMEVDATFPMHPSFLLPETGPYKYVHRKKKRGPLLEVEDLPTGDSEYAQFMRTVYAAQQAASV